MRLVLLVSGSGTNLQAVIDAARCGSPFSIAAIGSDVPGCGGLARAEQAGIPTFAVPLARGADRAAWNRDLCAAVRDAAPDLVVSSGFMKILGSEFLDSVGVPVINTHPALLPSFPGAHAVRDALVHGVRVTGATLHLVDAGVDTGPIIEQVPVRVHDGDDETTLHERIKVQERQLLVDGLTGLAEGRLQLPAASSTGHR
ncbi:phosphoribosylglycinamide formyltransferase [Nesterenkonia aerolata]|uniref:Phosphoribosylglycinamide formyltransferase n=1 Tax=Nesterenkonia aerolata TaxID=3074079 RepID=A0ABU2DT32_9MICC|nr:phosphoribosylglycinamide formyltransferase [Nesterenkonia sp. LY-0111]MDR8019666.1 phosphoribosylglycinamide formyltransferase [Nesterenkonia sp. LY-0111]